MTKGEPQTIEILVIERTPEIGSRVCRLLRELPAVMPIGPAQNRAEALKLFRERRPAGVILDLDLPGKSGLEFLAAIRREDPACLIIVLASLKGEVFRRRSLELGADLYFETATGFEKAIESVRDFTSLRT